MQMCTKMYNFQKHEDEKKRKYAERGNEIEHGTFTPLVFTITRGMSKECKIYHSRLPELIANKKGQQYHTTIAWIRAKTCFSLLRSSLVCLRGSRTLKRTTNDINNIDMDIDPYHSMSKQKILPVKPLIQCEAGRAKTMQRQSLYSPKTPKWPPSDKGKLRSQKAQFYNFFLHIHIFF